MYLLDAIKSCVRFRLAFNEMQGAGLAIWAVMRARNEDEGLAAAYGLEIPKEPELKWIWRRLVTQAKWQGTFDDVYFDRIYPSTIRALSQIHWTPTKVVQRAVELLTNDVKSAHILDVGSGVGKFCLIGATVSEGRFFGIEQRAKLVTLSQLLARHHQIPRVTFIHGDLGDLDWSRFDGVYFFNPFQEQKTPWQRIDAAIELSQRGFHKMVCLALSRLRSLRIGARVVTYHGLGAPLPDGFELVSREHCVRGMLECWKKTA